MAGTRALLFASGLTLWVLLAAAPASARPQDEVLSLAFKCAAIGDLRTWLDCYYGAAQPMRSAIGLPPVPAAQFRLVTSPPAGTTPPPENEIRDDVLKSALDCNRIAAERQWLDCYYAAPEPVRVRLGLASPSKSPAKREAAPSPSQFGLAPKPLKATEGLTARMTSYEFNKDHLFVVTLDNGQVWQQIEGDDSLANWSKSPRDYRVVISRGMFGSYNFRVLKNGGLFKVRRVR
jgi:hypothetical protein